MRSVETNCDLERYFCSKAISQMNKIGANMNRSLPTIAALFVATLPYTAHAQGTLRGAEEGATAGE